MSSQNKSGFKWPDNPNLLVNDKSEAGLLRRHITTLAFEKHDPMRKFDNLNPMLQEDWLEKAKAVLTALDAMDLLHLDV